MVATVFLRIVYAAMFIAVLTPISAVAAEITLLELLFVKIQKQGRVGGEIYMQLPAIGPVPTARPNVTRTLIHDLTPMVSDHEVRQPVGHAQYCRRFPEDCRAHGIAELIIIDQYSLSTLIAVNTAVNEAVIGVDDLNYYGVPEFWTYPYAGYGDCEDYVLEKRRRLIKNGFPESSLLITVVKAFTGQTKEGHAVLTVRTDRGDLVLDSVHSEVLPWQYSPHDFIARQSPFHSGKWETITDRREPGLFATLFGNQDLASVEK